MTMKMLMRGALLAVCLMVAVVVQAASLSELRTIYLSKLGEVQRELVKVQAEIGHAYEMELGTQMEQAKLRGDNTSGREIGQELTRYRKRRSLPQHQGRRAVSVVTSTAAIFEGRLSDERRLNAQKVLTLATQYDGALASLEQQLAGQPADAAMVKEERAFLAKSTEVVEAQRSLADQSALATSHTREAAAASTVTDAGSVALRKRRPTAMNRLFALTFEGRVAESPGAGVSVSADGVTPTLSGRFGKGATIGELGSLVIKPFEVKDSGTVGVWLKPSKAGLAQRGKSTVFSSGGQALNMTWSGRSLEMGTPYVTVARLKGVRLDAERWIHLALTWSPQVVSFYANGELVGSQSVKADRGDGGKGGETLVFGSPWRGNSRRKKSGQALTGVIDDVLVYSRALSAAEVAVLAGK